MASPVTHTDEVLPAAELIRMRAAWLGEMRPDEREGLDGLPLRQVDDRFHAWLDARGGVGDHGGG